MSIKNVWDNLMENFAPDAEPAEDRYRRPVSFNRRSSSRVRRPNLRFNAPTQTVSVWKNLKSFEDVSEPAEYLASGSTVVLNLELVEDEMECMRIFDFMNGVIFAMNGVVEDIGNKIKVYVPNNNQVDMHDDSEDEEDGYTEYE
ncbi:MAG: cell division protein SepF [Abditibacteriota bacterium]|nr:cell division protein SepF [Abditibacteriota bacterium]